MSTTRPPRGSHEIDALLRNAAEQAERIQDMREQLHAVRGAGVAADGLVETVVLPGGMLESVEIAPKAMRLSSDELAAALVESATAAAADASAKAGAVMEAILPGAGSEFAAMADPTSLAADRQESEEKINAVIDALRRGFAHP